MGDLEDFERDLEAALNASHEAFMGKYKDELDALMGVSRESIDAILPGTTDLKEYDRLIAVVKEASRKNLAQAELRARIEALGDVAMRIVEKVPRLAALFV